jgi:hypothetical protein
VSRGREQWGAASTNCSRQTQDRDVAAGAERDRERRGDEQHWLAEERAKGVAEITREILDDCDAARVARLFAHTLDSAECAERHAPAFGGRHASRDILFDLMLDMRAQFTIELGVDARGMDERADTRANDVDPSLQRRHDQAFRSVRRIAADRRSHCVSSTSSCARPAFVSE